MLAILFYVAETWTLKARHLRKLTSFHNVCVRTMMEDVPYCIGFGCPPMTWWFGVAEM